jgi:hypothetical protein
VDRVLKRRKTCRLAGTSADQVRTGGQPQDCKSLGIDAPANALACTDEVID